MVILMMIVWNFVMVNAVEITGVEGTAKAETSTHTGKHIKNKLPDT